MVEKPKETKASPPVRHDPPKAESREVPTEKEASPSEAGGGQIPPQLDSASTGEAAEEQLQVETLPAVLPAAQRPVSGTARSSASGMKLRYVRADGRSEVHQDFWIGELEVTQSQWSEVMGTAPSLFTDYKTSPHMPVESVPWYDVLRFANALSEKEGLGPCYRLPSCPAGALSCRVENIAECTGYELPTAEQWRFAALGGRVGPFGYGAFLSSKQANFAWDQRALPGAPEEHESPPYRPIGVGKKAANAWLIHDMHGNVREWIWPKEPSASKVPALGGSYSTPTLECGVEASKAFDAGRGSKDVGFRILKRVK